MKKDSLISENIGKALLLFVLPLIAGSLIQQLYTTVDAVIVGQFTGKVGLAAIDSVHTLFKFPINFMNGLATGATIMISRYFGAKDKEDAEFTQKIKLSENSEKVTNPGNKTIYRIYDKETGCGHRIFETSGL